MARLLFLQNIWVEFLGTMSLAAIARQAGHEVGIAIGSDIDLLKQIKEFRPDVAAFSIVTGYHHWALAMARRIKETCQPPPLIVAGGPHATFFPEIADLPEIDVLCRGEGEGALLDILAAGRDAKALEIIPNVWLKRDGQRIENRLRPLIQDLDALPFMDRTGYYQWKHLRNNPVKRFMSGRGCPHECAFCFNHSYKELYRDGGPYVRKRSPANLIEELQHVTRAYPTKTVLFEDDLFGADRVWLSDFVRLYRDHVRLPFICFLRADMIDGQLVRDLKEANCINVVFGVESGDERLRNDVLGKHLTDDQIFFAGRMLRKHGVNFCTTNILGLPGETLEQAVSTIRMNLRLRPTFIWCSVFQPYPRTKLGNQLLASGAVTLEELEQIDANYHNLSVLQQPDIHRSVNLHKLIYIVFAFPWLLSAAVKLSALPPNPLFKLLHRLSFLEIYARRWNISLWRAAQEGIRTAGFSRRPGASEQSMAPPDRRCVGPGAQDSVSK